MSVENLLSQLEYVKRTGTARYQARCPAHDEPFLATNVLRAIAFEALVDVRSRYHDPDIPKPVKTGNARNSPGAFITAELHAYIAKLTERRDAQT